MDSSLIAVTPAAPYYAVIFTSVMNDVADGYGDMSIHMVELAARQEGFLGLESARNAVGITVSYWTTLDAIKNWKANTDHLIAQKHGWTDWYACYKVRICKVERDYEF